MKDDMAARIAANPKYQKLKSTRTSYSIIMTILVMLVYYGYILLVAFDKQFLATKLGAGMVTSIGIPMGVGVIVITIILTNIYVRRANSEFDDLTAEIVKEEAHK
jgi:uncharacterized membrane protein (DUF485 family)